MAARCICGYDQFLVHRTSTQTLVRRWVRVSETGAGSHPAGLSAGTGEPDGWGLFEQPLTEVRQTRLCKSCQRERSNVVLSSLAVYGFYFTDDGVYVVVSDLKNPAGFQIEFSGPGGKAVVDLRYVPGVPPSMSPTSEALDFVDTGSPQPAAVDLLFASFPEGVSASGDYLATLIHETQPYLVPLGYVWLEETTSMTIPIQTANLGLSSEWLRRPVGSPPQLAGGADDGTIRFEKCAGVIEYDAREGALPSAKGWTLSGTNAHINHFSIPAGGALLMNSPVFAESIWSKTVALSATQSEVHLTAEFKARSLSPSAEVQFRAIVDPGSGTKVGFQVSVDPSSVEMQGSQGGNATTLDLSDADRSDWVSVSASVRGTVGTQVFVNGRANSTAHTEETGAASGGAARVECVFGATEQPAAEMLIRKVIVSSPGKFVRPQFVAWSPVDNPTLRLYVAREAAPGTTKARFRVRYGSVTTNLYSATQPQVAATINAASDNQVYELPITLTGAGKGLIHFTVERDWSHADDSCRGAMHLHGMTLRGQ